MSCLFYSNSAAQIPKPLKEEHCKFNLKASFSIFVLQFWTKRFSVYPIPNKLGNDSKQVIFTKNNT